MVRRTLVLVLCALVSAAFLSFGTASANPVSVELVGAGPVWDSITFNGTSQAVYLGPYTLSVAGGPALPAFCFDAGSDIYMGQMWSANSTNDPTTAAAAWFPKDPFGLEKINMISRLASLGVTMTDPGKLGALNEALWEITADYGSTDKDYATLTGAIADLSVGSGKFYLNDGTYLNDAATFLTAAFSSKDDAVVGQSAFLIPVNCSNTSPCDQPFVSPVAEPSTLLLLASSLAGLGGFAWRRRR
jgi:PEP-CTERM motif